MWSIRMLVSALALTLLAVSVGSWSDGNLSGSELTRLFNSPVHLAERMTRPMGSSLSSSSSSSSGSGLISHSGVRVTLDDGSQWLVHKGKDYGISSQTVVTSADQMSSAWRPDTSSRGLRDFEGSKTVGDFVATGGSTYNLLLNNCHTASKRMMKQ